MNIHENVATQAITSFFYHESLWKKEILFNFLLEPFSLTLTDIKDVVTQDNLKDTIPDFTIITKDNRHLCYEVKINDADLTKSERQKNTRNAYLIKKDYSHFDEIPINKEKILFWDDLFELIDKKGATKDFARLDLVREYINAPYYSLLLTPHEVAMLYSPETIFSVLSLSEKILELCENFLDSHSNQFSYDKRTENTIKDSRKNPYEIGYYFNEIKGKKRNFFIGLAPAKNEKYYYSLELQLDDKQDTKDWHVEDDYAYFPLDKEILAKFDTDDDLQEAFNKNVEEVLRSIDK